MAFQIKIHKDYTAGMVAMCDVCGEIITDASKANVTWIRGDKFEPGALFPFKVVHKGPCDERLERVDDSWQELDEAFVYLLNNTGSDIEKARERAVRLASLGL
jgi:hypothetical protein